MINGLPYLHAAWAGFLAALTLVALLAGKGSVRKFVLGDSEDEAETKRRG
jgi:hypothetical protein